MDDSPAAEGLQPGHVPPCPCQAPAPGRPLPDLMAVHLAEVPASWPPYDDEVPPGSPARPGVSRHPAKSQAGESHAEGEPRADGNESPGRIEEPAREEAPAPGHRESEEPAREEASAPGHGQEAGRERGSGGADSDRWPSQFAQVLAETLAGSRPADQITPWTTERARAHIRRLGPLLAAEQRPRVQRVLTSRPVEGVVEVAVIVGFGPRTRALAARLERAGPRPATLGRPARHARWLCTAVESA